ncbi:MAG: asparagine synthase-related protein [Planctomycetaceae bacterium]
MTEEEATERLDTSINSSVKRQMVSDVPLGAFLSGGLDSSAVVRGMKHSGATSVDTFTIGFEEASFDNRRTPNRSPEF